MAEAGNGLQPEPVGAREEQQSEALHAPPVAMELAPREATAIEPPQDVVEAPLQHKRRDEPVAEAAPPAPSPEPRVEAEAEDPNRPKRGGWWNKLAGRK